MYLDALNKAHPKGLAHPKISSDPSGGGLSTYHHGGAYDYILLVSLTWFVKHKAYRRSLGFEPKTQKIENPRSKKIKLGEDEDGDGGEASKPKSWMILLTLATIGDDLVVERNLEEVGEGKG
ncbi:hypothetical protein L6452_04147 [Arctium lappa]|uniref:Uncharacterized protein n=1 Tax=Arctium lappa TaxID=4217 RepID=A0ACB9FQ35_ARCLA|nr:hypothetical protein L6452_04147 [Arctium lappa]